MDTEEQKGNAMKFVVEKIWGNYLLAPNNCNDSFYTFVNPNDDSSAPSLDDQNGAIQKIEGWNPPLIENCRYNPEIAERIDMKLILPRFKKFRARFANPRTAYSAYRISQTIPEPLPDGTKWEHIFIRFLNGHEVRITLANDSTYELNTNFSKMGFENNKKHEPNMQWELLQYLSIKNGELSWENNYGMSMKKIYAAKKKKQKLSEALRHYFQIDNDPFFSYRTERAYKIKINLIPE